MRLLLVRHGQTPSNVLGALDTGLPGAPLTPLGQAQAAAIPEAFATRDIFRARSISAIYASSLLRTQLTAAPLAEEIGVRPEIVNGLREISAGSIEMLTDEVSQRRYTSTAFAWARGDLDLRMPGDLSSGAENGHEFFARYDAALSQIRASAADTVIVVSHGAAIRTWVSARCDNIEGHFAADHQLDNTGAAVLESVGESGWRLEDWHRNPVGGDFMTDASAVDPIGETLAR